MGLRGRRKEKYLMLWVAAIAISLIVEDHNLWSRTSSSYLHSYRPWPR